MPSSHYRSTAKYAAGKTSRTVLRDRCDVMWTCSSSSEADSRTAGQGIHCLFWNHTVREISAGGDWVVTPCTKFLLFRRKIPPSLIRVHCAGSNRFLRNVGTHLPRYMLSQAHNTNSHSRVHKIPAPVSVLSYISAVRSSKAHFTSMCFPTSQLSG